jgi:hypothetical protein
VENVTVQRNAFIFCRYSVAVLIWCSLVFQSIYLMGLVFLILLASALLKVHRAPMIWLYTNTAGRFIDSPSVVLDVRATRFAHSMGALLALVSLSLIYRDSPLAWYFVAGFAILKTLSALGFCPAYKLWGCATSGGCCALTGKR